ncbi:CLUMA_CG007439, isoform A [Clunio marinus]|uniref:CLUMA_CG007439, isoform A n=1 Tax=Clunio marinus TaxID=568069 RepID=A0A1J1I0Q2_9DIPT|nr:CLUMA_CG007439, isoform A [Clunio marinus]
MYIIASHINAYNSSCAFWHQTSCWILKHFLPSKRLQAYGINFSDAKESFFMHIKSTLYPKLFTLLLLPLRVNNDSIFYVVIQCLRTTIIYICCSMTPCYGQWVELKITNVNDKPACNLKARSFFKLNIPHPETEGNIQLIHFHY